MIIGGVPVETQAGRATKALGNGTGQPRVIAVAAERIKKNITDDDQKRLIDRYVEQLKS